MLGVNLWICLISVYCVAAELSDDYEFISDDVYIYDDNNSTSIEDNLKSETDVTKLDQDSDFTNTRYTTMTPGPTWNWRRTNDFTNTRYTTMTPGPTWNWRRTNDFKNTRYTSTTPGPTWDWKQTNDFKDIRYTTMTPGPTWNWRLTTDFQKREYTTSAEDWIGTTINVCDCGENSVSCEIMSGKKKCTCLPGYAQIAGVCSDCYCGENAEGCHFDSKGNKMCNCSEGYSQRNRRCSETCSKQSDCLNGGLCKVRHRASFCECKYNFGGDRCEVNEVCKRLTPSCDSIGGFCRPIGMTGICVCPSHKIFSPESGLCEDICDTQKCVHGTCEIIRKNFNCICDYGFSGTHCDQRVIYIQGYEVPLIVTSVFLVVVLFFSVVMVYFLYRKKNLNAATRLQGK